MQLAVAELAAIRAEPRDDAEQVTQVLAGEPLIVGELRADWARVVTAYDYSGWVRHEALCAAPSPDWLGRVRPGDPLDEARSYLGAPYEWGGLSERGIDCSGLVHMAYRRLGRLVPRDSDQQEAAGREVPEAELERGDLVCYDGHIAFSLGDGRILHSTQRDGVDGVVEEDQPTALAVRVRRHVRL